MNKVISGACTALAAVLVWSWAACAQRPVFEASELEGSAQEKLPGKLAAPDLSGPQRAMPRHVASPLPNDQRGSIRRVETGGRKLVALTFDLCELSDQRAGYDAPLVAVLRELKAPATFFAGGRWMRSHPERAMQLMADPLFEVGSHAWTHGNFGVLGREEMARQIDWTQAQYELLREDLAALAGKRGVGEAVKGVRESIAVFRFPYGRCSAQALELLAARGLAAVQWDVNMMDAAKSRTAEAIVRDALRQVRPGSIVLGHANGFGHATAEALRALIPALREKGYELVTVSALLEAGKPATTADCYDSRPGDTAVYDAQFGEGTVHPRRNRP
ncbi:polysaccharide deacetylase family protein [Fundidesulfovibrio soli]|uniref:polysaccharide deacetylase family protein n=1 Tax=Fundidesulfovibrio soli TaxID=2922716 RepID=UPI001FAF9A65|nr:polysaccharide deacetylase family protein [Fundidesulfovibrio soli]